MITGELKSKVDRICNTMWSGGISNPLSVIEQLTYLLFIKGLDELHTRKEHKAARTGKPIEEPVFAADQDALRWSRFKELAPEQMFETVRDRVFPFIKSMGRTEDSDEGSTYSHHMQTPFAQTSVRTITIRRHTDRSPATTAYIARMHIPPSRTSVLLPESSSGGATLRAPSPSSGAACPGR